MIIRNLRIVGFRNLKSGSIRFSSAVNAFVGLNAQGKTNILEAVSVLAEGRSFRNARLQEMIVIGSNECAVEGLIEKDNQEVMLKVVMSKGARKFHVNDNQVNDLRVFLGNMSYVVFSAESMAVIDGDPRARRNFLDHGCFSIDPSYLLTLREYRKALKSRNTLLKTSPENRILISTWNVPLSRFGAQIISARLKYLSRLKDSAAVIHQEMAQVQEQLVVSYQSNWFDATSFPVEDINQIEAQITEVLERDFEGDVRRGSTLSGPHRDELKVILNGQDLRYFGSRGQKRTAVLSLKLAELNLFNRQTGDNPILILDDIASEFDEERQMRLIRAIPDDIQVIISHTDRLNNRFDRPIQYFNVDQGHVTMCPQ